MVSRRLALRDRISQIDTADHLPTELDPGEIKRVSASIYGLRAISEAGTAVIALELRDLTDEVIS